MSQMTRSLMSSRYFTQMRTELDMSCRMESSLSSACTGSMASMSTNGSYLTAGHVCQPFAVLCIGMSYRRRHTLDSIWSFVHSFVAFDCLHVHSHRVRYVYRALVRSRGHE